MTAEHKTINLQSQSFPFSYRKTTFKNKITSYIHKQTLMNPKSISPSDSLISSTSYKFIITLTNAEVPKHPETKISPIDQIHREITSHVSKPNNKNPENLIIKKKDNKLKK